MKDIKMENRLLDQQLDVLRDKILLLGGTTEAALQRAMQSLTTRDSELAKKFWKKIRLSTKWSWKSTVEH
jgi:phosphate uptake regulator